MLTKFSRKIRFTDPIIEYSQDETRSETLYTTMNNCHWGTLKLFYSEVEFLVLASKYIDINECLVVYVGAQPGFRLKYLFIKHFFPKIKMLLYDPLKFDIESDDQIIIKTNADGWFDDNKISEVLDIANGRKILYISDIRLGDESEFVAEEQVHEDMQKQQRWGVNMGAEFMLLKFRMFFYEKSPSEINFIDNTNYDKIKEKTVLKINKNKHNDTNNWLAYLKGSIYTQLYAKPRSTESRLFVKKIKYHTDANKYSEDQQDKYKMKYYDNLKYEGLFNYFNLKKRNDEITFKKSAKLTKYLPGQKTSYTSASEYYIIYRYLKYMKIEPTLKNILNKIILVYTFFNNRYNNNLIICNTKTLQKIKHKDKEKYETVKKEFNKIIEDNIMKNNIQFENLRNTNLVDNNVKSDFIASYKEHKNLFFNIKNGNIAKKN